MPDISSNVGVLHHVICPKLQHWSGTHPFPDWTLHCHRSSAHHYWQCQPIPLHLIYVQLSCSGGGCRYWCDHYPFTTSSRRGSLVYPWKAAPKKPHLRYDVDFDMEDDNIEVQAGQYWALNRRTVKTKGEKRSANIWSAIAHRLHVKLDSTASALVSTAWGLLGCAHKILSC